MAANGSAQGGALGSIRNQRKPPDVPKILCQAFHTDLDAIVRNNQEKHGLGVVVGITNEGPAGVKKDMENMTKALETLDIAVWKLENASRAKITGVLRVLGNYNFPTEYKFIIFYFSGHGGSLDKHAFICTDPEVDEDENKLFIEEGIISPLLPKNTHHLGKFVRRIFLFDSCLVDDTIKGPVPEIKQEDISIPSYGNVLVAFATSISATARADPIEGGVWTRYLTRNMVEADFPLTVILDLTWEDTVMHFNQMFKHEIRIGTMTPQGPHYSSSAGLIWLQHPDRDSIMCRKFLIPTKLSTSDESEERGSPGEDPSPQPNTLPDGPLNTSHLLDLSLYVLDIRRWLHLGLALGLDYDDLDNINKTQEGFLNNCKTAMFNLWIKTGNATKSALVAALNRIGESSTAKKIG